MRDSKRLAVAAAAMALAVSLGTTVGCSNKYLNVAREVAPKPTEDAWAFKASPQRLYQAVLAERDVEPKHKRLAEDPTSLLVSWVVPVTSWADMEGDASGYPPKKNKNGTALTTVWVEQLNTSAGGRLHIRRVFLAENSPSNVGSSRGDYEADFVDRLRKRLNEIPPTQTKTQETKR